MTTSLCCWVFRPRDGQIKLPLPPLLPFYSYNLPVSWRGGWGKLILTQSGPRLLCSSKAFWENTEVQHWTRGRLAEQRRASASAGRCCEAEREREGWKHALPQRHLLALTGTTLWRINTSRQTGGKRPGLWLGSNENNPEGGLESCDFIWKVKEGFCVKIKDV